MTDIPKDIDQRLVDYQLGQLEGAEAEAVARLIREHPEVAARHRRLVHLLSRLDGYTVAEPPADLAERVLERVESFKEVSVRVEEAGSALPSGMEIRRSGSPIWSLGELVGLAAAITIVVGVFLPAQYRARYIARRDQCAANLAQLGVGVGSYANDHADAMPFAGYIPGGSWLRVAQRAVRPAPNSRHVYLLAKRGYVGPMRLFVCPGRRQDVAMGVDEPGEFDDFAEPANISYSSQNQGRAGLLINVHAQMPVLADRNPFVGFGQFVVREQFDVNSDAHGRGTGQNVLYCDGSVRWRDSAAAGPEGDNIWLAGEQRRYRGTEEPQYATDAFVIP